MHVTGEPDGPPTSVGQPICDLGHRNVGRCRVFWPRYTSARGPAAVKRWSARFSRPRLASQDGPARAGWSTGESQCARGPASPERALPAPRDARRLHDDRNRDRAAVATLCSRARARGLDRRPALSPERRPVQNRAALEQEMEAVLSTRSTADCVEALDAAGVPCGPVNTYAQLFADPQVRHLGMVARVTTRNLGGAPCSDAGAAVAQAGWR